MIDLPHHHSNELLLLQLVLDEARRVLRQDGWCQGAWGTTRTPKCLEGAIAQAAVNLGLTSEELAPTFVLLQHALQSYIPAYNDAVGRTLPQVLGVVEACIEALESRLLTDRLAILRLQETLHLRVTADATESRLPSRADQPRTVQRVTNHHRPMRSFPLGPGKEPS